MRTGQVLIEFDADYVAQNAPSLVSVIAIANSDAFEIVDRAGRGMLKAGETPLLVLRAQGRREGGRGAQRREFHR